MQKLKRMKFKKNYKYSLSKNEFTYYNRYGKFDRFAIFLLTFLIIVLVIYVFFFNNRTILNPVIADSKFSDINYLMQKNNSPTETSSLAPSALYDNSIIIQGDDFATNTKSTTTFYGLDIASHLSSDNLNISSIFFAGTAGDNIDMVLMKQGVRPMTLAPFTIPATTTPVEVSLSDYKGKSLKPANIEKGAVNPCVVNGVEGNLTQKKDTVYFTRLSPGSSVTLLQNTPVSTFAKLHISNYVGVIFIGNLQKSDLQDIEILVSKYRALADNVDSKKYIIVSNINGTKDSNKAFDTAMIKEFGDNYLNLRDYLSLQVFDDFNIQPTAQDIRQILNGETPNLFFTNERDSFSHVGNEVFSELLFNKLVAMGYLS